MFKELFYALLLFIYPLEFANLERIIDGDTIETSLGTIRLLGINSPEKGQRCFFEATQFLKNITGQTIIMQRDLVNKDKYDRFLRHLNPEQSINLQMVENGYAKSYNLFPNYFHYDKLINAQIDAIKNEKGCLWKSSNNSCIRINEVNKYGQWVKVQNICNKKLNSNFFIESDGRQREEVSNLCASCSEIISIKLGNFVFLFDDFGLIDFMKT